MTKAERRERKQQLFKESVEFLKSQNANLPAYHKRVEELAKGGMELAQAARQAHGEHVKGHFVGLSGKKLRFMAKQRADILIAGETHGA